VGFVCPGLDVPGIFRIAGSKSRVTMVCLFALLKYYLVNFYSDNSNNNVATNINVMPVLLENKTIIVH